MLTTQVVTAAASAALDGINNIQSCRSSNSSTNQRGGHIISGR
jgi:hypothetical protein